MSDVPSRGELILYRTGDGRNVVQLRMVDGTVWLTQAEIAALFDTTEQNVSLHLKNIFGDEELLRSSVVKESLTAAADSRMPGSAVTRVTRQRLSEAPICKDSLQVRSGVERDRRVDRTPTGA
jgi:hypothetical protein